MTQKHVATTSLLPIPKAIHHQAWPVLSTLSADTPIEHIVAIIERDGGVIVADFLTSEMLFRLNTELNSYVEACSPGSRSERRLWKRFHGHNTKRFCGLAAKSETFVTLLLHPTLQAYADHFLLPHCGSYWLNTAQMIVVGPGEPQQMIHRDEANWPHFPWPGPELTVSCIFALTAFTEENGATHIAPGSHRWADAEREARPEENTQAVMPAGSVLLYTGKVLHGAGANRTADFWRRGLHVSFVLGWLRPEEHHTLAVPLEVARKLPERVQQLLGYVSYHPLGYGGRLGLVDFEDAALVVRG